MPKLARRRSARDRAPIPAAAGTADTTECCLAATVSIMRMSADGYDERKTMARRAVSS
jgi:hypothetical protein